MQEYLPVFAVQTCAACRLNQEQKAFSRKSLGNSFAKRLLHIPFSALIAHFSSKYPCAIARETERRMEHHETQTVVYEHAQNNRRSFAGVVAVVPDHE